VEESNVENVGVELEKWSGVTVWDGAVARGVGSDSFWGGRAVYVVSFRKKDGGKIGGPWKGVENAELRLEKKGWGVVDNKDGEFGGVHCI